MRSDMNLAALLALLTTVLPAFCQDVEDNAVPPTPQDTICGDIIRLSETGTLIEARLVDVF
jgi:hypothetical protein